MESTLTNIAEQVPALAVLAWIVTQFLRHQRETNKDYVAHMAERDVMIHGIITETRDCLRETRDCINQATGMFGEVRTHLVRLDEAKRP